MTDVSVIIVSYNTRELTLGAVRSVFEQTSRLDFEVIVVDNGSKDGSVEALRKEHPAVTVISRPDNPGFAGGNNIGARYATGEYFVLLNPDTEVLGHAIEVLHRFATETSDGGAWGGVCLLADGSVDPGSRQMEPSLKSRCLGVLCLDRWWVHRWTRDEAFSGEVPVLEGAFMMVKRDLWEKVGGFDESFRMYGDEADLCRRIRGLGRKVYMTGAARIRHYYGGSQSDVGSRTVLKLRGLMHYYRKHNPRVLTVCFGLLTWFHTAQRFVCGYALVIPLPDAGRRLIVRYREAAMHPWKWWSGWDGEAL